MNAPQLKETAELNLNEAALHGFAKFFNSAEMDSTRDAETTMEMDVTSGL